MTSPLVARLVTAINSSVDEEQRALHVAELACYLARTGEFEEAESMRLELRRDFADGHNARVSILIMCIEALLLYYRELSPKARDWMARANLLSKTFHEGRLTALTSAWMAHIDFNQNRFDSMSGELQKCADFISADDGNAECRASLVLGDAFLFAGDTSTSRVWYEVARRAATALGDHSSIGALTYNRAALRVAAARFNNLITPIKPQELSLISVEVNSAINYQAAARLKSLDHLLRTAKVGVLMLMHSYEKAKVQLQELLRSEELADDSSQGKLLLTDLMFVRAKLEPSPAVALWVETAESLTSGMMADDRALLLSNASTVAGLVKKPELETHLKLLAEDAIEEHAIAMKGLLDHLVRFKSGKLVPNKPFGLPEPS